MTKNMERKMEKKYLAIILLMIASSGQSIAMAEEETCVRPSGHITKICGTLTLENGQAKFSNINYQPGTLGYGLFMYVKPHQFSSGSICKAVLQQLGKTFETSTKRTETVWEMYETRNGKTGCRGHRALHEVTCDNVSDL